MSTACEQSGMGAENKAKRAEHCVSGSGAISERAKNDRAGAERGAGVMDRERSGERTKLTAQISLKGDATQT